MQPMVLGRMDAAAEVAIAAHALEQSEQLGRLRQLAAASRGGHIGAKGPLGAGGTMQPMQPIGGWTAVPQQVAGRVGTAGGTGTLPPDLDPDTVAQMVGWWHALELGRLA